MDVTDIHAAQRRLDGSVDVLPEISPSANCTLPPRAGAQGTSGKLELAWPLLAN